MGNLSGCNHPLLWLLFCGLLIIVSIFLYFHTRTLFYYITLGGTSPLSIVEIFKTEFIKRTLLKDKNFVWRTCRYNEFTKILNIKHNNIGILS